MCVPVIVASGKKNWLNYESKYIHKPWFVVSLCCSAEELGILLKASVFRSLQSRGLAGQLKLFKCQDTLEDPGCFTFRYRLRSLKANSTVFTTGDSVEAC